jgi:hypothetical protein
MSDPSKTELWSFVDGLLDELNRINHRLADVEARLEVHEQATKN